MPDTFPLTRRSRNLVRFARHLPHETLDRSFAGDFAFRARGSRFSVLKSGGTAPGPDECWGLLQRDTRLLFRKLLGLEFDYPGLPAEQQQYRQLYNAINYYRSHVEEQFVDNGIKPFPPLDGSCTFCFAAADQLVITYRLRCTAAAPVPLQIRWVADGEPGLDCRAETTAGGFRFGNAQRVHHDYWSWAELTSADAETRFSVDGSSLSSAWLEATAAPGADLVFRFLVRFWFDDQAPPAAVPDWQEPTVLASAIAETERAYELLPKPAAHALGFEDLVLKAGGTLLSLRYRDFNADGRPVLTIHAGKTGCAATWFWDTAYALLGLGLMQEREAAAGAARMLLGGIAADGTPSVTYEDQAYVPGYQMPILAWGLTHYLSLQPDRELLQLAYPALSRYVNKWLSFAPTPDSPLVIYPAGGTALDDSLRWHTGVPLAYPAARPWHEQPWGRSRSDRFLSVDVNTFLWLELQSLALMADALGEDAEATAWRAAADRHAAAINADLFDPETRIYQDRSVDDGRFSCYDNMAQFMPIMAGLAAPALAERLCREYLLSPAHYRTTMPFPVVSRSNPTFRAGGFLFEPPSHPGSLVQQAYWVGRTWPHVGTWLLGALCQAGLTAEADACAAETLLAMSRNEGIHETYDSLTGYGNGHPEFMWSSAAVLVMASGYYRQFPLPRSLKLATTSA